MGAFNPNPLSIKEICKYHCWSMKQLRSVLEKNYVAEIVQDAIDYEMQEM